MTSKDILALMECKRKYMIRDLSLKGQDERGICFQKALRICARGIAKGKKSEMLLSENPDISGKRISGRVIPVWLA